MSKVRMAKKIKFPDLVMIEWGDAWSNGGWNSGDTSGKPADCVTIGWIEDQNKKGLTLVSRLAQDDEGKFAGMRSFIPTGMIRKIIKVKHSAILWGRS